MCFGLRCVDWIGNRDDVKMSDDGKNSQWWGAAEWRGYSLRQRIGCILDNESPRGYASSFIAGESFAINTDSHMSGSTVKNHISKSGIRLPCNTENFVPIVVPGLSASSSSSLSTSTPKDTIKARKFVNSNTHDHVRMKNWSIRSSFKRKCG